MDMDLFLDEILKQLQKDRNKPLSQREHLNPDIVLREIIKTDRHEDFLEIINILKEEGMIKRINENERMTEIDKSRDVMITVKGSRFLKEGGYSTKKAKETNLSDLESEKKWYETENARRQFENYQSTRNMAIIATIVSIGLLLLRLIEWIGK
ncbi:hypothetical protein BH10BAC2_BH10BAC2_04050 [soil metagenome]